MCGEVNDWRITGTAISHTSAANLNLPDSDDPMQNGKLGKGREEINGKVP
jgi:hypothetical protein